MIFRNKSDQVIRSVKQGLRYLAAGAVGVTLCAGLTGEGRVHAADLPTAVPYEVTTESGFEVSIVPFYLWLPDWQLPRETWLQRLASRSTRYLP